MKRYALWSIRTQISLCKLLGELYELLILLILGFLFKRKIKRL